MSSSRSRCFNACQYSFPLSSAWLSFLSCQCAPLVFGCVPAEFLEEDAEGLLGGEELFHSGTLASHT